MFCYAPTKLYLRVIFVLKKKRYSKFCSGLYSWCSRPSFNVYFIVEVFVETLFSDPIYVKRPTELKWNLLNNRSKIVLNFWFVEKKGTMKMGARPNAAHIWIKLWKLFFFLFISFGRLSFCPNSPHHSPNRLYSACVQVCDGVFYRNRFGVRGEFKSLGIFAAELIAVVFSRHRRFPFRIWRFGWRCAFYITFIFTELFSAHLKYKNL